MQAFCRYGPGKAYLYSHGLDAGDRVLLDGRNYNGNWLWVQPENLNRHCWAAASVMEIHGEIALLHQVTTKLPYSTLYGPPQRVEAVRFGSVVTIAWEAVWMTQDDYRGYLIEANVCQGGQRIPFAMHVDGTSTEVIDEPGCSGISSGKLYTVEKHGYTDPVLIPWP